MYRLFLGLGEKEKLLYSELVWAVVYYSNRTSLMAEKVYFSRVYD